MEEFKCVRVKLWGGKCNFPNYGYIQGIFKENPIPPLHHQLIPERERELRFFILELRDQRFKSKGSKGWLTGPFYVFR